MKNFVLYTDFSSIATQQDLEVLSSDNSTIITQCNRIAIAEAAGYLQTKYDLEKLFADPIEWSLGPEYTLGNRLYCFVGTPSTITFYTCIKDAPVDTAITNTEFFEEIDDRDQKLLEVIMSMSLFYIHKRLSPNNIPEFRINSYDGNGNNEIMSAIKWLGLIQSGKLFPFNWPIKLDAFDLDGSDLLDDIGDNPANGLMYGNDMGDDYIWYNRLSDPNIVPQE